ncbi:MAG TPA: hypothetical protein VGN07_04460 [Steroidobacteraceae bacterium]
MSSLLPGGGEIDALAREIFARMQRDESDAAADDPQGYLFRLADDVANERSRDSQQSHRPAAGWSGHLVAENGELRDPARLDSLRKDVEAVMKGLPRCHREAFVLYSNEGLNCEQIAQRQGVAREVVLQKLVRTYTRLRFRLEG